MTLSTRERFNALIAQITHHIGDRPLDADLENDLNRTYPFDGGAARLLIECCRSGVSEGWMCSTEVGGLRFGRVMKPDTATGGFSVDAVGYNATFDLLESNLRAGRAAKKS